MIITILLSFYCLSILNVGSTLHFHCIHTKYLQLIHWCTNQSNDLQHNGIKFKNHLVYHFYIIHHKNISHRLKLFFQILQEDLFICQSFQCNLLYSNKIFQIFEWSRSCIFVNRKIFLYLDFLKFHQYLVDLPFQIFLEFYENFYSSK